MAGRVLFADLNERLGDIDHSFKGLRAKGRVRDESGEECRGEGWRKAAEGG